MSWHCLSLKDKDRDRQGQTVVKELRWWQRLWGKRACFVEVVPPLHLAALGLPDLGSVLQGRLWVRVRVCLCVCLEWVRW